MNPPSYIKFEIYNSEFENVVGPILSLMERNNFRLAPTLAFIDPFGFKGFSMNVVSKLLLSPRTEVLITFMDGYIKRFIDERNSAVLNELFGCNEWRKASSVSRDKEQFLLELYTKQLHQIVGQVYTRTFGMKDRNDRHIYNLLFATKNLKGLEVMKEVMFKIDRRGAYKFSDKTHPHQKFLIDYVTEENSWISRAADMVFHEFKKNTVNLDKIEEFVISKTPYVFRKDILKHLESSKPVKILNVHGRTRKFTYPDNCTISFAS
ncbi:MAG: three-Cys-motif partner protein TcmP [Nitrososphaeraceae archaeon]